jgi:hypothetical protein
MRATTHALSVAKVVDAKSVAVATHRGGAGSHNLDITPLDQPLKIRQRRVLLATSNTSRDGRGQCAKRWGDLWPGICAKFRPPSTRRGFRADHLRLDCGESSQLRIDSRHDAARDSKLSQRRGVAPGHLEPKGRGLRRGQARLDLCDAETMPEHGLAIDQEGVHRFHQEDQ